MHPACRPRRLVRMPHSASSRADLSETVQCRPRPRRWSRHLSRSGLCAPGPERSCPGRERSRDRQYRRQRPRGQYPVADPPAAAGPIHPAGPGPAPERQQPWNRRVQRGGVIACALGLYRLLNKRHGVWRRIFGQLGKERGTRQQCAAGEDRGQGAQHGHRSLSAAAAIPFSNFTCGWSPSSLRPSSQLVGSGSSTASSSTRNWILVGPVLAV